MPAVTGRTFVIKKAATAIAGGKEVGMSLDNSPVDITDLASGGYRELADFAGKRSLDIQVSGVWKDKVVRDQAFGASLLLTDITIDFADGGDLSGDFYLSSYDENGTDEDAVKFTATLQSSGSWTYTPAP